MNYSSISTVYIIGLGAIGSVYAAIIHEKDPHCVKIIASPERQAKLKANPTIVNGKAYSFDFADATACPPATADLIIVAVKSRHLNQAINEIQPFIRENTIVISLVNGISSEETLGKRIGFEHMLYAYAIGTDAVREDNHTNYRTLGMIVYGEKINNSLSEKVTSVKAFFESAGIPHEIPHDMYKALWFKFMMNTGVNQASAVLKAAYGIFQKNQPARELMRMAAEEVLLLSRYVGANLEVSDMEKFLNIIDGLNPLGKTSMLQDIEAGRESEVDSFAGTVIALGKKYGIHTPVNNIMAQIIRSIENGI